MTSQEYDAVPLDGNDSALGQDDVEQELPSSSQFYIFFHPALENEWRLSALATEFLNTSVPHSNVQSIGNRRHLSKVNSYGSLPAMYKNHNGRTYAKRTKSHKFDLDMEPLAEEYTQMVKIVVENEKAIKEKEIILDMQDKELEVIIADIAELCDLNVTLTKDMRQAKTDRDHSKQKAKECRLNKLSYESGAMMLASENEELKVEIEKLQKNIDKAKEINKLREENPDVTLEDKLKALEKQIKFEAEIADKLEEKVDSLNCEYEYKKGLTMSCFEEGEPCLRRLDEVLTFPKNEELYGGRADELCAENNFLFEHYDQLPSISQCLSPREQKISPKLNIIETSVPPATPGPENNHQYSNIFEALPSISPDKSHNEYFEDIPREPLTSTDTIKVQELCKTTHHSPNN